MAETAKIIIIILNGNAAKQQGLDGTTRTSSDVNATGRVPRVVSHPTSEQVRGDHIPHLWQQQSAAGCCRHVLVVMMQLIGAAV
jgi:hypothetical protein